MAHAVKYCQNLRRPAKESPESCNAARQAAAALAQAAKPLGSSASSFARIACANTGAAPSVEMPMTKGERLTMAPNEKSQNLGLSITLTGTPDARAAAAKRDAASSLPNAPIAMEALRKSCAVHER